VPRYCAKTSWPLACWLFLCVFLNCDGWLLSAVHQLNAIGYLVSFVLGAAAFVYFFRRQGVRSRSLPQVMSRFRRRFARVFPGAFLVLTGLVFLGGLLYPPTNYDGLSYREPRVLHWLAEGQWHWIHTLFHRLNVRACGFEWLSTPLILFTRTDRTVFLINFISFLFLPGLTFSLFMRLGVRPRAAWYWMWLFPTGYCFLLQAGSIANDLVSAVFAAAALDFALRARVSKSIEQFWLSCLAAALLTGAKSSNLPLLLPWSIAILPSLPLLWRYWAPTMAVAVVAAGCSFLPVAVLNWKHCGDWSGQAAEQALFKKDYPVLHVAQNGTLIVLQNFVPPVFPMAKAWDRAMSNAIPAQLEEKLTTIFEGGAAHLTLPDMQTEEAAGLGLGVSALLLITFAATFFGAKTAQPATLEPREKLYRAAILAAAWVSPLPLLMVSGATTPARYLAPQYAWMAPVFLLHQTGDWTVRRRWWRGLGIVIFAVAALLVVISPARPLWPANLVLSRVNAAGHPLLARAQTVYSIYGGRADGFAPVRERLPADAPTIGVITFDDPETSLWRPFGTRRIRHVLPEDTRISISGLGIKYVLVNSETFQQRYSESFEHWLNRMNAELSWRMPLGLRASRAAVEWSLVRLRDGGGPAEITSAPVSFPANSEHVEHD